MLRRRLIIALFLTSFSHTTFATESNSSSIEDGILETTGLDQNNNNTSSSDDDSSHNTSKLFYSQALAAELRSDAERREEFRLKTSEAKTLKEYLELMDQEFNATTSSLYDFESRISRKNTIVGREDHQLNGQTWSGNDNNTLDDRVSEESHKEHYQMDATTRRPSDNYFKSKTVRTNYKEGRNIQSGFRGSSRLNKDSIGYWRETLLIIFGFIAIGSSIFFTKCISKK